MAIQIRNTDPAIALMATVVNDSKAALVAQLRLAQADVATIAADPEVAVSPTFVALGAHNDRSEVLITAADATTLETSVTLVNQLLGVYAFHMADTLAHKVVGVALASYVPVSDSLSDGDKLTAAIALANDIKSKYNTHRASTTYHYTADSTNVTSAADATDQGSLNTLLTELKADINAHLVQGYAGKSVRLVSA